MVGRLPIRSVTAQELRRRDDVEILDVREPDEWRAGHIDGSRHIPMSQLGLRLDELDRTRPLVVVCRVGERSAHVTAALGRHGYDAANLDGGLEAWNRGGLPLVSEDGGPGQVV